MPIFPLGLRCLLLGLVLSSGVRAEALLLLDGAREAAFEIAIDEVQLAGPGLDRVVRLEQGRLARATLQGVTEINVVLYPVGRARTEGSRRILTRRVSVQGVPGTDWSALATAAGAVRWQRLDFAPDRAIFFAGDLGSIFLAARLREQPGVRSAQPILARKQFRRAVPNDPLFPDQWTLRNTGQTGGTPGADAAVVPAWDSGLHGEQVVISIVDDGVELLHPDLAANIIPGAGYDYRDGDNNPNVEGGEGANENGPNSDAHGTSVAGVAAAAGNNGRGVAGAAYAGRLVPIRLIGGESGDDQEAMALAHRLDLVQVSNNSWGADDDGKTLSAPGPLALEAITKGVTQGRGGLGIIYVWSAGNGGNAEDNSNNDGYANSPFTVAVGALDHQGKRADYSEPGANLVVSAPAGYGDLDKFGTWTTDVTGNRGYNRDDVTGNLANPDYTRDFDGTSSAAPLVSGVVALILQANPQLGWRDVQEVLLRSAAKTDPQNAGWFTNAAGLKFNHDFGAGRIDAGAAVTLSRAWIKLGPRRNIAVTGSSNTPLPATGQTLDIPLSVASDLRVEQVTVQVDLRHPARGELRIDLVSPAGTVSQLFRPHDDPNPDLQHQFMTVFNWAENARGVWHLRLTDTLPGNAGSLASVKLEAFGTTISVAPLHLVATELTPEGLELVIEGPVGASVRLEGSTTLDAWMDLGDFVLEEPVSTVVAPTPDDDLSFYRLLQLN